MTEKLGTVGEDIGRIALVIDLTEEEIKPLLCRQKKVEESRA